MVDFAVRDSIANPHIKAVVRIPRNKDERPIAAGTASNHYTLAQHVDVAKKCFQGITEIGIDPEKLKCELGLSGLGEWMNLRIYFPDKFSHTGRDKNKMALRLECFNSVDRSSRIVILLGWFRFVCSNGLVIGNTKAKLKDVHNQSLNLERIPNLIKSVFPSVDSDTELMRNWEKRIVQPEALKSWVNTTVTDVWNANEILDRFRYKMGA